LPVLIVDFQVESVRFGQHHVLVCRRGPNGPPWSLRFIPDPSQFSSLLPEHPGWSRSRAVSEHGLHTKTNLSGWSPWWSMKSMSSRC